jgi:hypothetical protein
MSYHIYTIACYLELFCCTFLAHNSKLRNGHPLLRLECMRTLVLQSVQLGSYSTESIASTVIRSNHWTEERTNMIDSWPVHRRTGKHREFQRTILNKYTQTKDHIRYYTLQWIRYTTVTMLIRCVCFKVKDKIAFMNGYCSNVTGTCMLTSSYVHVCMYYYAFIWSYIHTSQGYKYFLINSGASVHDAYTL